MKGFFQPQVPGHRGSVGPLMAPTPEQVSIDQAPVVRSQAVGFNTLGAGRNVATVAATPVQLVAPNPVRRYLFIQNTGTEDIYIGGSSDITTTNGLLIKKNCAHEFNQDNMYYGELWAYSTLAATLRVFEGT